MEKISIIVPVYKVENYLKECVDSILNQTFTDFELILVDDGSPDNSGKMCDEFAIKDNRIKVIHKENGGLSSARNAGLDVITGEYVCFVDSDDLIHNKTLELLYNIVTVNKPDIAVGRFNRFLFYDEIDIESNVDFVYKEISSTTLLEMAISDYDISFSVCNKIFNSSLWKEVRFREGTYYEDEDIVYKIFDKAKRCMLCDYKFYFYRMNINSTTNKITPRVIEQYYTRKGMYEFVKEKYPIIANLCYAHWFELSTIIYYQYKYFLRIDVKQFKFLHNFDKGILSQTDRTKLPKKIWILIKLYIMLPFPVFDFFLRLNSIKKKIIRRNK
jgi:glycosyltransferase involved in cell wall biosynthesis